MNIIQRHIQYLVATTDCVILPGWGGLIAAYTPAEVSESRGFVAPKRSLVFNPALTHDDGRLAMSISRRQDIPYEKARAEIAAEVDAMHAEYDATGMITIPRIGSWRRSPEGSMIFTPNPSGVASARYAYLPTLPLPVAELAAEVEQPDTEAHIMRTQRESFGRRMLRVAAFLAILLGLVLTLSNPINVNFHDKPDLASVGSMPTYTVAEDKTVERTYPPLVIAVPDSALAVAPVAAKPRPETAAPKFYLIIGSFPSEKAANRWIEKRPETELGIIEYQGKYRVYAATGQTLDEAMAMKSDADFSRRNPEAWVYRRR